MPSKKASVVIMKGGKPSKDHFSYHDNTQKQGSAVRKSLTTKSPSSDRTYSSITEARLKSMKKKGK